MAKKPYIIVTASPKGGVGKTIISINVAAALRAAGQEVLLVDTDVANPSVSLLLGSGVDGAGYAEVIQGESALKDVLILYPPSGFYYLSAGGGGNDTSNLEVKPEQTNKFYTELAKSSFDFIIIDTPPGTEISPGIKLIDEALIITTPEEPAVRGAQRLSQSYTKYHLLHKLVINRTKEGKYQLAQDAIEKLYGDVAYSLVPEEKSIDESEAKHTPAYLLNRTSLFSMTIDDLCRSYLLKVRAEGADQGPRNAAPAGGIKKFFKIK